jgi:general secretion pathway protein G
MHGLIPRKAKRGFTLVEIVVVITLIGLLSTFVILGFRVAQKKARDAQRIVDMQQLHLALESFYKVNGRYPAATEGACAHNTSFLTGGCMTALVTGGYIGKLPTDPSGTSYYYDGWCAFAKETSTGPSSNSQQFRMWTTGEMNHDSRVQRWWLDTTIGETTCWDPS